MTPYASDIAEIEARILQLEEELVVLKAKREELVHNQAVENKLTPTVTNLTPQQKVTLFKDLFRGREDIYAFRWTNKQGRSGYTVACQNEWIPQVCNKPKIKCGECTSRQFKPLTDSTIYDHLSGKITAGVYPLLAEDLCYFLAIDLDKSDWQDAVNAIRTTCNQLGMSVLVERSRSGNGAHVWIFFEEPTPARDARRLGFTLLDRAMEVHSGLSFESYDRLFPNQDTMPEGGFGNLIALPLQHSPRKQGNSSFIDEYFNVLDDQWGALTNIQKISVKQLNQIIDTTGTPEEIDDELKPWEIRTAKTTLDNVELPEEINIVLANKIYIDISNLPDKMIAQLKRLASFSNPVFFKQQAMRFSTNGIPRFICLATIEKGYLCLPRGCQEDAEKLLSCDSVSIQIDDEREPGKKLKNLKLKTELRKEQKSAIKDLSKFDVGVLHAPTAFGKTITAIGLIHKRKVNTLILVHSRQLLGQWKERLNTFLEGATVGIIGGGKRKPSTEIDIATYQSLIDRKSNTINDIVYRYGQVIIDECHHISAPNYELVLNEVHAKYVLGVTATPHRQDGHQPIIFMHSGPIRHKGVSQSQSKFDQRVLKRPIYCQPPQELLIASPRPHISEVYKWLTESSSRNDEIISDISGTVSQGRNPIVLTERRGHAELLAESLNEKGISYVILKGGMRAKERQAANDRLNEVQVIVATGKYIGEGFDLPKLDTLFLALPISWKGSLAQYAGRIHRESEGKESVMIYDYVDYSLSMLERMFAKRLKGYEALGYKVIEPNQMSQAPLKL